ncbi:hypothetical protein PR048_012040 [Dryococelus australis]|uniref:Uncharacterized protein n=1 Tax=Dryococelus australis TaxID=614101 RepID=A0ABQ9HNT5_9NEOP|nr:hypothetical protein PR048_012040 [Dryococelus australis]
MERCYVQEILRPCALPFPVQLDNPILQQENARPHTARTGRQLRPVTKVDLEGQLCYLGQYLPQDDIRRLSASMTDRITCLHTAGLKGPACPENFSAFEAEKRGSSKDCTATCIKCVITATRRALNWRAVFSSDLPSHILSKVSLEIPHLVYGSGLIKVVDVDSRTYPSSVVFSFHWPRRQKDTAHGLHCPISATLSPFTGRVVPEGNRSHGVSAAGRVGRWDDEGGELYGDIGSRPSRLSFVCVPAYDARGSGFEEYWARPRMSIRVLPCIRLWTPRIGVPGSFPGGTFSDGGFSCERYTAVLCGFSRSYSVSSPIFIPLLLHYHLVHPGWPGMTSVFLRPQRAHSPEVRTPCTSRRNSDSPPCPEERRLALIGADCPTRGGCSPLRQTRRTNEVRGERRRHGPQKGRVHLSVAVRLVGELDLGKRHRLLHPVRAEVRRLWMHVNRIRGWDFRFSPGNPLAIHDKFAEIVGQNGDVAGRSRVISSDARRKGLTSIPECKQPRTSGTFSKLMDWLLECRQPCTSATNDKLAVWRPECGQSRPTVADNKFVDCRLESRQSRKTVTFIKIVGYCLKCRQPCTTSNFNNFVSSRFKCGQPRYTATFKFVVCHVECRRIRVAMALWLKCSPPTKANCVRFPAGPLAGFRKWESCRWLAAFLGDLPFPPLLHSNAAPYSHRFTLIGF